MAATSENTQPQDLPLEPLSTETIDLLLAHIPAARLIEWLGEQTFGHSVLRGFQQTAKSLRLSPVRKRLREALLLHPNAAQELSDEWKMNHQELFDAIIPLSDRKLLKQLPALYENDSSETIELALLLIGRERILQQQTSDPPTKTKTKKTSSKKPAAETAELEKTVASLLQENEVQRTKLEKSDEKLRLAQEDFKQEIRRAHEQHQQTLSGQRDLARDIKRETARAQKAEQQLDEITRHAHRNERRLKKLQQEHEKADLEIKRLRRQVRQQQQIAEDLRKQLSAHQPPINQDTKVLSKPAKTKTTENTTAAKRKLRISPADQQFFLEVAGRQIQISARQVAQAVERNDEELVFSLTQALFTLREANPDGCKMFLERVRTFDRYSARVLTGDTTRVLVDASNVARFEKNKFGKGILENLLALRDELRSRSYFPIILIADASLPYFIDEPQQFKKLVQQNIIQVTNKGEEADEYLTRLAQKTGAFVVTNDVNFHQKTAPNFEPLRIGFTIDKGAVYLHEF